MIRQTFLLYGICDWIWENPPRYAQELKYILLLVIIATLEHCPDTITQLYCISGANHTWLLSSIRKLKYFEYFKSVFLEIQASVYMEGFPKSGHI